MIPVFEVHANGVSYRTHHYLEAGRRIMPTRRQPWITQEQAEKLVIALAAAPEASILTTTARPPSHRCSDPACACHSLPPAPPKVFEAVVERERQHGLRA